MTTHIPFTSRRLQRETCSGDRGHSQLHEGRLSGIWDCRLLVVTPLCIKSYFVRDKPVMIPSHSLRGMVRSVVEILGASCARFKPADPIPADLKPCSEARACIACRIFGFVDRQCWQGKVAFCDSARIEAEWIDKALPPAGGSPPIPPLTGGWRFFEHLLEPGTGPLACVSAGTVFPFRVRYEDLRRDEYDMLKFALTLSHFSLTGTLCHKIGYGKEIGLGSCVVTIEHDTSDAVSDGIKPYIADLPFRDFVRGRALPAGWDRSEHNGG